MAKLCLLTTFYDFHPQKNCAAYPGYLWTSLVVYENIKKQTLPDGEKCHKETLTFQVEKGYNFSLPS